MFLNGKEEKIIGKFMNICEMYEEKEITLKWDENNCIKCVYDSYIEDETDCELEDADYEEFWSFVFEAIEVIGEPPVYITEDDYFCVDYRNFPDEIIADGKKIN